MAEFQPGDDFFKIKASTLPGLRFLVTDSLVLPVCPKFRRFFGDVCYFVEELWGGDHSAVIDTD